MAEYEAAKVVCKLLVHELKNHLIKLKKQEENSVGLRLRTTTELILRKF